MTEPRSIETERVLVALRWLSLAAIVILTQFVAPGRVDLPLIYRVVAVASAYNLICMFLLSQRFMPRLLSEVSALGEVVVVAFVLFATGGIDSPLVPFAALPIFASAFRISFWRSLLTATLCVAAYASFLPFDQRNSLDLRQLPQVTLAGTYFYLASVLGYVLGGHERQVAERGLALEKEAAREATVKLKAVHAQSQAISEVASILSSTLNYRRVLETILTEFYTLLGFQVGVVFLFEQESGRLRVATERGLTPADRLVHLSPDAGAVGKVVANGDPLLIANPAKDEELRSIAALSDSRSALCVPLRTGFEMYGAVLVARKEKDAYTTEHLDLLQAFANQAVLALQNAQLYQSLRKERDRVVADEEEARRTLARDLHDGPVQKVAAIAMKAEVIKRIAAFDPSQVQAEAEALADMAHRASQDLRTVLFELRPVMLESRGLSATLAEFVNKMRESQGAPLHLDADGFTRRLPASVESTIFTVVQEAVHNAMKHASPRNIIVRLSETENDLSVTVEDDGKGFDQASVEDASRQRGSLGLLTMRERAEMLDGILSIRSIPGVGTAVTLRVPLPEDRS